MTTHITAPLPVTYSSSNLSGYKAWVDAVKAGILAVGLLQTNDTGQLDTSTLTSVPSGTGTAPYGDANSGNLVSGYHMFRFPDELQDTSPIFIRVNYMFSTYYALTYLKFGVSTGTNGEGLLNTPVFVTPDPNINFQSYNTTARTYLSYVDGTFCVVGHNTWCTAGDSGYSNSGGSLIVDRARSATGAALGKGFLCESATPNAHTAPASSRSRHMFGPSSPEQANSIPCLVPNMNAASSADGANVNVFRHYMMTPGVYPSLGSLSYFFSEFGALTPLTVPVLGSNHVYLPMGRALSAWSATGTNVQSAYQHSGMIRWE